MTGIELLAEAVAAAPAGPQGLETLRQRQTDAEGALQASRRAFTAVESDQVRHQAQAAAVKNALVTFRRDRRNLRQPVAQAFLGSLEAGKSTSSELDKLLAEKWKLTQRGAVLEDVLTFLAGESFTIAVRRLEAEVAVQEKITEWIRRASHVDLAAIHNAVLPLLSLEPAATVDMTTGSKSASYAQAFNESELRLLELRESLKKAVAAAKQYAEQAEKDHHELENYR
jgi:hypothetical protein